MGLFTETCWKQRPASNNPDGSGVPRMKNWKRPRGGGLDGLLGQGFRAFAQAAAYCDSAFTPLPSSSSTWFLAWLSAMAFWIRAIASWAAMVASAAACAAAMVDPASP